MQHRCFSILAILSLCVAWGEASQGETQGSLDHALAVLQKAGPGSQSQSEFARSWQQVAAADSAQLVEVLAAMDHAGPLADNWLRAAVETIVERETSAGRELPVAALERFLGDQTQGPRARRLTYELLVRLDPSLPEKMLPEMLEDSSLEIRYDAVAQLMAEADALGKDNAFRKAALYEQAVYAARDFQQVKDCATALEKLGKNIDATEVLGFITDWRLVGPFDNTGKRGFDTIFPPETRLNLNATYRGKQRTVNWTHNSANDEDGKVDLNKALGKHMGAVAYAAVVFTMPKSRSVECRLTSVNANKIWVNGQLVSSNEVYHSGSKIDQYRAPAQLRSGRNTILLKICQNEQTDSWAQDWVFQFRLTDELGGPIPLNIRSDVTSTDL